MNGLNAVSIDQSFTPCHALLKHPPAVYSVHDMTEAPLVGNSHRLARRPASRTSWLKFDWLPYAGTSKFLPTFLMATQNRFPFDDLRARKT